MTSLTVADTTAATWNTFDLASVGPVGDYPEGADEVRVGYCTSPVPCTASQFLQGPFQTGNAITLPAGVDPATVTGIEFTFANTAGTPLPPSSNGGRGGRGVHVTQHQPDDGGPHRPDRQLTQSNCATPSAVDAIAGPVTGADACVNYTILPGIVGRGRSKQLFADANGSYTNNGFPVSGQNPPSGVTGITTAKNTSAFNVTNLTITDPSTTAPERLRARSSRSGCSWCFPPAPRRRPALSPVATGRRSPSAPPPRPPRSDPR